MKKNILLVSILFLFQSCYFGAGLVEIDLPGKFFLFGNNSYEEIAIWNDSSIIVEETVFAVGYNDDFIIAKSIPRNPNTPFDYDNPKLAFIDENDDNVLYHILLINNSGVQEKSEGMNLKEYELIRRKMNIPYSLKFSIIIEELLDN